MKTNDIILEDPLNEIPQNTLPKFATTLGIDHYSPSQMAIPDGSWLFKYLALSKEQKEKLPANAAMKGGVAVGDILQKHYADIIWKFGQNRKLVSVKNKKLSLEEAIEISLEKYKHYEPADDKDSEKKFRYLEDIPQVTKNAFNALEEIGVANDFVTCEEQVRITKNSQEDFIASCLLPVEGRTDFILDKEQGSSLPKAIIELKTAWTKLGKVKVNGDRSFIRVSPPVTPSFNHLCQCAFYSAYYKFKVPVYLVSATAESAKVFTASNCPGLTVESLKKNYQTLLNVFKRRERILSAFENLPRAELIKAAAGIIDPMMDHPYAWNGIKNNGEMFEIVKELFNLS
jgi:hypothetical protein|tara:strand:+ start:208 stop:1239 length:1032 start_codon:yes stop_codon:yes gene_type:complete